MKFLTPFLFMLVAALFTACHEDHSCCTKPVVADKDVPAAAVTHTGSISDMSIYNLESDWTNQAGSNLKLEALKGKVQLVTMIYTSCGYACPRIIADLKEIEGALKQFKTEELGVVLVTMDPERDTPARLHEFAGVNNLNPDRWVLLTGQPDNILELGVLLNMKYKKELNGQISHSNTITVLDAGGEVVHQQEGLGVDPDKTIETIRRLLHRS